MIKKDKFPKVKTKTMRMLFFLNSIKIKYATEN